MPYICCLRFSYLWCRRDQECVSTFGIECSQLTDLIQENATLKGKILTLNEHLNETQLETKASRETIMRLVSEMGREQKVATRYTVDIEKLRIVST